MNQQKMKEHLPGYMVILLSILEQKKVLFLSEESIIYTILPALSLEGFIAVDIMEGSCDKERFQTFVLTQLVIILFLLLFFIII